MYLLFVILLFHITKELTARDIYISDEATKSLKEWLDFKYRQNTNISSLTALTFQILIISCVDLYPYVD